MKSILNEFKLCDANKSGGLDKEEFRVLLAKVMDIKGKVRNTSSA